jgi:arylsulfatase A-like enzyme
MAIHEPYPAVHLDVRDTYNGVGKETAVANRRPNILLITTDQQRYDHLGLAGVRGIRTPNLDRLGTEGVHFNRAYTCSPICTPARVSLLTGLYPSVHRAFSIGVTVDPFPRPTIADLLSASGYTTALFGKAHFVRRDDEEQQFAQLAYGAKPPDPEYYRDHTGPFLGFDYVQTDKGHTTNRIPGMHYRAWLEELGVDYREWYPDMGPGHDHGAAGLWNIPEEYHDTRWVTDTTVDWIRRTAPGGEGDANGATGDRGGANNDGEGRQPWFVFASYQDPHEPFVCPDPWYSSVQMDEVSLYEGNREGEFDDKPRFYREAYEAGFGDITRSSSNRNAPGSWASFNDGRGIPSAFNRRDLVGKELAALQATLGMVSFIDSGIGDILNTLEETGQIDDTVIIFTTDHGEIHGHHGLWHKGLFCYEDNQRIPMLAWGPGRIAPIGTTEALVNLVDIPRTILTEAGVEIPQGMQGTGLQPVLRGEAEKVQEATIVELEATKNVYQQTYITDRYKLVVYRDFNDGELYDLEQDPEQYRNLWNDSACASIRGALLHAFIQENMRREGASRERQSFA